MIIVETVYGVGGWMPEVEGENIIEIREIEIEVTP